MKDLSNNSNNLDLSDLLTVFTYVETLWRIMGKGHIRVKNNFGCMKINSK